MLTQACLLICIQLLSDLQRPRKRGFFSALNLWNIVEIFKNVNMESIIPFHINRSLPNHIEVSLMQFTGKCQSCSVQFDSFELGSFTDWRDQVVSIVPMQVVSIVLYNLMTNQLVKPQLKDRLRGAAHIGRAGGASLIFPSLFSHLLPLLTGECLQLGCKADWTLLNKILETKSSRKDTFVQIVIDSNSFAVITNFPQRSCCDKIKPKIITTLFTVQHCTVFILSLKLLKIFCDYCVRFPKLWCFLKKVFQSFYKRSVPIKLFSQSVPLMIMNIENDKHK